jgi:hypothetical protein
MVVVRPRVDGLRFAIVTAAVIWGVVVVVVTEALSAVHAFTFLGALVLWTALVGFLGWMTRREPPANPLSAIRESWRPPWRVCAVFLALGAMTATVALIAVTAPPNTWDSMTYHMSRAAHWIQNGSVAHYRTTIERQLHTPPWAEFAIANLQVLARSDRLANLVAWGSMIGSLAGVSLVACLLGGDRRAQLLTAVIAATIPMGVLQASSTQNNFAAALWIVCLAVFILHESHPALVGAALGLALLTKATSYVFTVPLMVWFGFSQIARERQAAWRGLTLVGLVALGINAGYFARNIATYGGPLGPGAEGSYLYVSRVIEPGPMLSVALRNLTMHLGTPWPVVNAITEGAVRGVHELLGLNVNDPRTTWQGTEFRVRPPDTREDSASNGVHLLLIVAAVVAAFTRRSPPLRAYALVTIAGFLLFCCLLRWQPWHSRLQLPLFVLATPLVGVTLAPRRIASTGVAIGLLLSALGPLLWNATRPLVGSRSVLQQEREAQYFASNVDVERPYRTAVARIAELGCKHIGLLILGNDYEYPIWVLTGAVAGSDVRIEHLIAVRDLPGWLANIKPAEIWGYIAKGAIDLNTTPVRPCAVFTTVTGAPQEIHVARRPYRRELLVPPVAVFVPCLR